MCTIRHNNMVRFIDNCAMVLHDTGRYIENDYKCVKLIIVSSYSFGFIKLGSIVNVFIDIISFVCLFTSGKNVLIIRSC